MPLPIARCGSISLSPRDRRIRRNKTEFNAFRTSGPIGFFLAAGLFKAPLVERAERIPALWNGIETFAARAKPGSMFELPMTSTRIGTLQPARATCGPVPARARRGYQRRRLC